MDGEAQDKECPNEEVVRLRGACDDRDDRYRLELHEQVHTPRRLCRLPRPALFRRCPPALQRPITALGVNGAHLGLDLARLIGLILVAISSSNRVVLSSSITGPRSSWSALT